MHKKPLGFGRMKKKTYFCFFEMGNVFELFLDFFEISKKD
jgi:hypothetical protein